MVHVTSGAMFIAGFWLPKSPAAMMTRNRTTITAWERGRRWGHLSARRRGGHAVRSRRGLAAPFVETEILFLA